MKKILILLIIAFIQVNGNAQVGINADNSTADASAMLDVKSTDKGILIPRMTTAQRTAIATPATGLLVFDSETAGFWFYNGSSWTDLSANGDGDTDSANEYNTGVVLNGTDLEIKDNGGTIITDLSGIQDADWLKTDGTIPTAIGNEIYRTGNLGIGANASNPAFPIDIRGTGGERIRTYSEDGFYAGLVAKNSTREYFVGIQADYEATGSDSGFHIYDNSAGTQRMVIESGGDVGIAVSNPTAQLHVAGDIRIVDGTQGDGKVLTSSANGTASWETLIDNVDDGDTDPTNEYNSTIILNGTSLETTDNGGMISTDLSNLVNDADANPTNEIELPSGGLMGQILSTDGSGTYSWITDGGADNLGNHTATQNITLGSSYISNDGTSNGIYIDASNNVGINTNTPSTQFEVNGTIVAGAMASVSSTTLNGSEGIIIPGGTSDYIISAQDGNGRIQHKWNASYGTNETFLVGGEDAAFLDINATASDNNDAWIEFKHADGSSAVADDAISWNTHMIINQGGEVGINETSPDDYLHVTSGGNGTRVRLENSGNGWAGMVAKNTQREIFIGIQGAFDANPGELHIYDNTAGARRLVIDAAGEVGIGKNNPSVKLDVNGSVNCTGGTCSSDLRWKKDIRPLNNSLDRILSLRGVSYDWRKSEFPNKDFNDDRQIGLIAQEVEAVFPELVKTDNEGYKSMDYMSFTAVLLEGMKAQQSQIDDLQAENEALKEQIKRIDKIEAMLEKNFK